MMNHSEYHIGPEVKSFCLEGGANGMKSPDWSDEPQNNGSKTSRSMSVRRTSNDRGALQHPKRFQDLLCVWTRLFLLVVSETVPDGSQRKVQVTSCGLEVFNQTTKATNFSSLKFSLYFWKTKPHLCVERVNDAPSNTDQLDQCFKLRHCRTGAQRLDVPKRFIRVRAQLQTNRE